ncbi:MAG: protoheme IX farnesyltransferase [Actinobacteria bacterium]|nr:protoheme IX farnesyltransferase [Actinomycetota bacterium]
MSVADLLHRVHCQGARRSYCLFIKLGPGEFRHVNKPSSGDTRRLPIVSASPKIDVESAASHSTLDASVVPAARSRIAAYVALTKPRIIELLLVTTVPVMFAAAHGFPRLWVVLITVLGGTLAAAGANAFNCVLDSDIDAHMKRTATRPTVTGEITRRAGFAFATILSASSVVLLAFGANLLSASLAGSAIVTYVVGYTMVLKRRTSQNIVWGGLAGCFPVLIGWAAVAGQLTIAAWVLFALVFLWTPAHYWPLSMKYREDYANAGVLAATSVVTRAVLGYTIAAVVVAAVYGFIVQAGWAYWALSALAGLWFVTESWALAQSAKTVTPGAEVSAAAVSHGQDLPLVPARAMRVFHVSISYLALVFLAVGLDPFIH